MLREYHFGFDELLNTSLKRFWFLLAQIERLRAEDDLRHIGVISASANEKLYEKTTENLNKVLGEIYVYEKVIPEPQVDPETGLDPEFDRAGLQRLRMMLQNG